MTDFIIFILILLGLGSFVQGFWIGYTVPEIILNGSIWFLLALVVYYFANRKNNKKKKNKK
tara:strand:- start:461 stop:643 length:183 start_codon:yes stop_codon:yes gene_type:complete